jgi:hypothetical protein
MLAMYMLLEKGPPPVPQKAIDASKGVAARQRVKEIEVMGTHEKKMAADKAKARKVPPPIPGKLVAHIERRWSTRPVCEACGKKKKRAAQ